MSRKNKIDPAEMVKIIERLLTDEISVSGAARQTGVGRTSIRHWRDLYLADGPTALMAQRNNKVYSQDLKLQAVNEYLDGKSCQADIVKKYHLRSARQLRNWIKVYTTHGEIKSHTIGSYIHYYNTGRIQRKLQLMTPVEYHENYYVAA